MSGTKSNKLGATLTQFTKKLIDVQTHWCIVKEVDWVKKTMICTGVVDNLDFFNVNLGIGSIVKKPKIKTRCLIGIINNNGADAFMIDCDQVEEMVITSGQSVCTIKEAGFIIKQSDESLRLVLNDLIAEINNLNDEVAKIVVAIGVTPNVPVLNGIKNSTIAVKERLNNILIA